MDPTTTTRDAAEVQAEIEERKGAGEHGNTKIMRDLRTELKTIQGVKPNVSQAVPEPMSGGHFVPPLTGPATERAVRYWMGTMPGAPKQNIDVGGVSFPLFTGRVVIDDRNLDRDAPDKRPWRYLPTDFLRGVLADLTPRQVENIKVNLARKFVVWRDAAKTRGYVKNIDSPNVRVRMSGKEEPVSRYVFMLKQDHRTDHWPQPIEVTGIEE